MPIGAPPWLPGGPYQVGCPSLRFKDGVGLVVGCGMGTVAPHKSFSGLQISLLSCRWSLREDRISLVASSIHLGLKGSRLGSLLSMYTSWNRSLISPWEV